MNIILIYQRLCTAAALTTQRVDGPAIGKKSRDVVDMIISDSIFRHHATGSRPTPTNTDGNVAHIGNFIVLNSRVLPVANMNRRAIPIILTAGCEVRVGDAIGIEI